MITTTVIAILVAIAQLAAPLWHRFAYDDRPAVVLHSVRLSTDTVKPGDEIRFDSVYSKRAQCFPPQGDGEVSYRLYGSPDNAETQHLIIEFSFKRQARWPPGHLRPFHSAVPLPTNVPPGRYEFQTVAVYNCHGASKQQVVKSPGLPIRVLAR